jgi:hypothetical protein
MVITRPTSSPQSWPAAIAIAAVIRRSVPCASANYAAGSPLSRPNNIASASSMTILDANLQTLNEKLQKRHKRAEFPQVFAGVDISLNVLNNSTSTRCWQLHFYGAVIGRTHRQSGDCKANGRRDTSEERLTSSETRKLAVWLDQYRLADRYLLGSCRKTGRPPRRER